MAKLVASVNILALGIAVGLFVWGNTRPEMLIVESFDDHHYVVVRNGPGWPVRAWGSRTEGWHAEPIPAEVIVRDHHPEDRLKARLEVWLLNGPIGAVLVVALLLNIRCLLYPTRPQPGSARQPALKATPVQRPTTLDLGARDPVIPPGR